MKTQRKTPQLEPRLEDMLRDPIVLAVMKVDGVEKDKLQPLLDETSAYLSGAQPRFA